MHFKIFKFTTITFIPKTITNANIHYYTITNSNEHQHISLYHYRLQWTPTYITILLQTPMNANIHHYTITGSNERQHISLCHYRLQWTATYITIHLINSNQLLNNPRFTTILVTTHTNTTNFIQQKFLIDNIEIIC